MTDQGAAGVARTAPPLTIRRATPDDYPAVGDLTVAAYLAEGALTPEDAYVAWLADVAGRADEGDLWVAEASGDVLGAVMWCPPGTTGREIGTDGQGEFRSLAVSPSARGRGVGTRLVEHIIGLSQAAGLDEIVLSSAEWMTTAHRLYTRLGFVRRPELDWRPLPQVQLRAFSRGSDRP